jgi:hypothetical protein
LVKLKVDEFLEPEYLPMAEADDRTFAERVAVACGEASIVPGCKDEQLDWEGRGFHGNQQHYSLPPPTQRRP